MARTTGEEVARKLRDAFEALDRHDVEPYLAMMAPDFEIHEPTFPEPIKGKEIVRKINEGLAQAFPDMISKTLSISVGEGVLAFEVQLSGTFKGPMRDPQGTIPPTGRHFDYTDVAVYRFDAEGLLTGVRNYGAGLREQLGLTG